MSRIIEWCIPPSLAKGPVEERRQAELVISVCVLAALPAPLFYILLEWVGFRQYSWLPMAMGVGILLAPLAIRFTGSLLWGVHCLCGSFVITWVCTGILMDRTFMPFWPALVIVPALSLLLSRGLARWTWSILCSLCVLAFFVSEQLYPLHGLPMSMPMATRSLLLVVVTIVCMWIGVIGIYFFERKMGEALRNAIEAERALALSESRLRTILDHAPLTLWSFDASGEVVLQEGSASDLLADGILEGLQGSLQQALEGSGTSTQLSLEEREYETEFVPVYEEQEVVGAIGVAVDVTARARLKQIHLLNQELELARDAAVAGNRAKSLFLANMSHELRTPLNAIIGYSELLMEEVDSDAVDDLLTKDLQRINSAGHHLLTLVADILDLSKIEEGKIELHSQEVALLPLLQDLVGTIKPLREKNNNELEVDFAEAPPLMEVDETRLRQVLLNLLSNACKFTNEGQISLAVSTAIDEHDVSWAVFRVQDTGIGISEEQQAHIFEVFTQGDVAISHAFGGSGLGLALSLRLCERMGGTIGVESQLGEGATFEVRLPLQSATS